MNKNAGNERYSRQILLDELGETGQLKLRNAKVLVIGAGGLGCPAIQYLTAAGVGTIGIADFDRVDVTNLHRQILYSTNDLGKLKVDAAIEKMSAQNPEVNFQRFCTELIPENALQIISEFELVIDGTDNYATRYMINDACSLLQKPLIYGAVMRFEGQVGVFNLPNKKTGLTTNYRDLFPEPPDPSAVLSCNEAGVLGIVPGIIGTLQATEAIKIISGIGEVLSNQVLTVNLLNYTTYIVNLTPTEKPVYGMPKSESEFHAFNYNWFCNPNSPPKQIDVSQFNEIHSDDDVIILDVRETNEIPAIPELNSIRLPMSRLKENLLGFDMKKKVIVLCQSGFRSLTAASELLSKFPSLQVYSLSGGVTAWKKFLNERERNYHE